MKNLLILFICLQSWQAFGQAEPETPLSGGGKLFIGFTFSPDINNLKIPGSILMDDYEPKSGLTTGINAGIQMNERISFETGIHYLLKGSQTKERGPFVFIDTHP